ncbi:substrate-binding domain-containing protein [Aestuariirhabdus sp. LZHN29]|uniref:substrate-binding domain-containing protein n=1 Tax=Aestuariirhabdus sp. LZHN29 TaxID=3417462 RepID=UPI003CF5AD9B
MKRFSILLFFSISLPLHANVFQQHSMTTNDRGFLFEIHGSNTIGVSLAPALVSAWFKHYGFRGITVTNSTIENEKIVSASSSSGQKASVFIAAHGSGTGFKQIESGRSDIAAASRPAKTSENDLFPTIDVTGHRHELVLAIDGIAVIINPDLQIESLTIHQVGQLFSGSISNWNQLGGPDLPVNVHARDNKSGTFDTFNTLVLKRGYDLVTTAKRYESNDHLSRTVTGTPGAIGFTSLASIHDAKAVQITDGNSAPMSPEHATIATEDYPLARRLFLYQVKTDNAFAADFMEFSKSDAGQTIVAEVGFISQNLQELAMSVSADLPSGYTFIAQKSKRITTNFRFRPGTNELDNKALDDLIRLRELIALPEHRHRKLILIGFSDQQRNEFRARLMSESRVMMVKRALASHGIVSSALTGYGQINPVATNTDPQYALRNQRVEVWIR